MQRKAVTLNGMVEGVIRRRAVPPYNLPAGERGPEVADRAISETVKLLLDLTHKCTLRQSIGMVPVSEVGIERQPLERFQSNGGQVGRALTDGFRDGCVTSSIGG